MSETPITDQLQNMLGQVGHPDYSLREFVEELSKLVPSILELELAAVLKAKDGK